ncbi:MAG: hypothetical protein ABJB86_03380 [Bacteroidota bacterium]
MKNIILLLLIFFYGSTIIAQGVFSNQTNNTLEKVVQDYPSQFKNIKGEVLSSKPGSVEYKSTITVPGAVSTTITQTSFSHRQTVSWQSVLYSGGKFDAAKNRFEELFTQIKNTIIKTEGQKPVIIDGQYNTPAEEKGSTSILFDLLPATGAMQKINIGLLLKNNNGEWKIVLSVSDKDGKETDALTAK